MANTDRRELLLQLGTFLFGVIAAAATGFWAVFQWRAQQKEDRRRDRQRLAALYVNPFMQAAEELQSRIYNILEQRGLVALRNRYPDGAYASETLYLIVQYFGWERYLLRYGPYTQDQAVIALIEKLRQTFATDRYGVGPFCFFRAQQRALGQTIVLRAPGDDTPEALSFFTFRKQLEDPPFRDISSVKDSIQVILKAQDASVLAGRDRLAEIQNHLVDLLIYLESKEGISLVPHQRRKAKASS